MQLLFSIDLEVLDVVKMTMNRCHHFVADDNTESSKDHSRLINATIVIEDKKPYERRIQQSSPVLGNCYFSLLMRRNDLVPVITSLCGWDDRYLLPELFMPTKSE